MKSLCFRSALVFFFLFFLHGTFKRRTELSHIAYNLDIESMLIHSTKWGYRNNKTKLKASGNA